MIDEDFAGKIALVAYFVIIVYIIIKSKVEDLLADRDYEKYCIKVQKNRELAADIIDEFEDLLYKKNIIIPNQDREYNSNEACIYGCDYYDLEDKIIEILNKKGNRRI